MLIFPVRHHSPASALQVERLIRARRPKVVLIEGPVDATPLIPLLLDPDTKPPVALYAYQRGERVRATFYPFCAYSPEYVALKAGQEVGARLAFCDLPAGEMLAWSEQAGAGTGEREKEAEGEETSLVGGRSDVVLPTEAPRGYDAFTAAMAEAAGFESFEELWEAGFEQDGERETPEGFIELLADFGTKARVLVGARSAEQDAARERHMAGRAQAIAAEGVSLDDMLLVCGAAHAAAIAELLGGPGGDAEPLEGGPEVISTARGAIGHAELALIPYSYPRLSEQSGYGAGNRAPWFYQRVWEMGGDYATAIKHGLVEVAHRLRDQGQGASLAECIDAHTLALVLAQVRGKRAPGVTELGEAAVACFGQGQPARVAAALRQVLIGDTIGRVTERVGRTPLQVEFYETAKRLGLPLTDAPRQVLVHLSVRREAEQSVFLHRLLLADVPYGRELQSGLGGRSSAAKLGAGSSAPGKPLEQLAQVREKWELQWSPATDARLVERTAWGSTLVEVCGRLLAEQLAATQRIDAGTAVLLKMALCELTEPFPAALGRCETLAADSGSFPALARATYHLDGLLTYGAARRLPAERLSDLAGRLFARAVLHLPAAAICSDEAAEEVRETLTALHDLVRRSSPVAADPAVFWRAIEHLAELERGHPVLRGLALVLLELDGRLSPGELAARLGYWLSATTSAADNAKLVAGLFSLHRATLVRNRALIGAVTDFLLELEIEQLTPLLPTLRRSLGGLSRAERAYLSETLARVLGLETSESRRALALDPSARAMLREADEAVAATLERWRDDYGIA